MTDKPKTPDGMSEAPVKFEHEAKAATSDRTKIQRLYQQALGVLEQFQKAADRDDGDPDRIYESFSELREQIMETPATCPQDVAVKLRLFANIMDIVDRPDGARRRHARCRLPRLCGAGLGPNAQIRRNRGDG